MKGLKLVLVGDTQAGKSSILNRFVQGTFTGDLPQTVGAAFMTKLIQGETSTQRLQIWDTAGQERYRSLTPMYYRSSHVAILVFDVTKLEALQRLDDWAAEIRDKAPQNVRVIVCGNKIDIPDRAVDRAAAEEKAASFGAVYYTEVSAKTGEGVEDMFLGIAKMDFSCEVVESARPMPQEKSACC